MPEKEERRIEKEGQGMTQGLMEEEEAIRIWPSYQSNRYGQQCQQ